MNPHQRELTEEERAQAARAALEVLPPEISMDAELVDGRERLGQKAAELLQTTESLAGELEAFLALQSVNDETVL